MPQNIYDDNAFFKAYQQMPRSTHGLEGTPEWPNLRRMLGDMHDQSVLDLGCGYGWFCRWALAAGAKSVHGIDISEKMLQRAREYASSAEITYDCRDVESTRLPRDTYDIVYSSLTFHYLSDLRKIFSEISGSLRAGGRFVFSCEHPIRTAPSDPTWRVDTKGDPYWPLNDYIKEGVRVTKWLGSDNVQKYHHTIETYLSLLIENGFELTVFNEFWDGPQTNGPDAQNGGHRPFFLLVAAVKAR